MIISASRRTDIPAHFSDWFFHRVREKYAVAVNPVNPRQKKLVSLEPEDVDGIVFWTKNPLPMLGGLHLLKDYAYYFQFTLNPYGDDAEPGIPPKDEVLVPAFQRLSEQIGPDRVIWRYDPIFFTGRYSLDFHLESFFRLSRKLKGYTKTCTISFLDHYRHIRRGLGELGVVEPTDELKGAMAAGFSKLALEAGIRLTSCAEGTDLLGFGISPAKCVDSLIFETLLGRRVNAGMDPNQRPLCRCDRSVDVGAYGTCPGGCKYCYAAFGRPRLDGFDFRSPVLGGKM